ncbi:hypothetical protein Tco_0554906, partial [Tanacetum coccineum]
PTTDYSFVDIVDATPRRPMSREVGYGITDVSDDMVGDMQGRADEVSFYILFQGRLSPKSCIYAQNRYLIVPF